MSILQDKNASKTLNTKIICQLQIKSDDTIYSYTAFNNALQSFLAVTKCTYFSIKSVVIVSTTLLTAGNQKMEVDKSAKLVSQFLPLVWLHHNCLQSVNLLFFTMHIEICKL